MRLRPLTDGTPKPLLPVLGEPILAHTLRQLAAAGCEAAAINLHHGGDQVRRVLGDELAGLPLTYSLEPRLLGTLGALRPLDDFLAVADLVLIVNGDSLCRWPFAELLRRHRERGAPATLLLAASADVAQFSGGIEIGRGGEVLALRPAERGARAVGSNDLTAAKAGQAASRAGHVAGSVGQSGRRGASVTRRRVFAGAHVLSPRLVRRIAAMSMAVPADIVRDLYEPLLAEEPGCLATLSTRRRWHDLGTPRRYLAAALDWAGAGGGGRWISPSAVVSPAASVRRVMIEADARVAAGAVVEGSVLLPGARVG